jgi:tetratricopeptide (TPR) repeat protein
MIRTRFRTWRWLAGSLALVLALPAALATAQELGPERLWQDRMTAAVSAHQRGDFEATAARLESALELAEDFGAEDPRLSETLLALALTYFDLNRHEEAAPLLERKLALDEAALGPEDRKLGPGLTGLGLIRTREGRYDEAEALLRRALAIYEKTLGPGHATVAQVEGNLGGLFLVQGRHDAALPHYARALEIQEKTLGRRHPELAKTLESYAIALRMTGQAPEAEALEARAETIRKGGAD